MNTEVLIVGAGPTGLSLAAQLIRHGVDFIILDHKEGVTDLSKALAVHARTLEIYEQMELSRPAIERGALIHKARMISEGETRAELDLSGIGTNMSPYPYVLTLEQSENEKLLYEFIQQNGKDVWWQTRVESFSQNNDGVQAVLRSNDGTEQNIEAKYLVGCDGAGSDTRNRLGVGFAGSTAARLFYVADVEMETELPRDTLTACFGPHAFTLFFPMRGEKRWRLIGNMPEFDESRGQAEIDGEQIEAKVKDIAKIPLDITAMNWFSSYKVHTRHASRFRVGRCFLAGDAAHIHTPAGGQGMNTGVQDSYNLAWKLAFALRGRAGDTLLETYNDERVANAERLLKTTDRLFDVGTGEEWYFRVFRDYIFPPLAKAVLHFDAAKEMIFPTLSQIGISYDHSRLSRQVNEVSFIKIKAGNRFPYFQLDGKNVFDYLRSTKFKLVTFTDGAGDPTPAGIAGGGQLPEWIEPSGFPLYPHVASIFGTNKTFSVLVRPDNYVGFIVEGDPSETLAKYVLENV